MRGFVGCSRPDVLLLTAGVPFSAGSQPEFCPHLKMEIDAYLTSSSESTRNRPCSETKCQTTAAMDRECAAVEGKTVGDAFDIARHMKMITNSCKLYLLCYFV